MILVVGATGTNGREVVARLVAQGQRVRALVRRAAPGDGVEQVVGDLDDPASLAAALRGVERAFVVTPVDERAGRWFANFLAAARAAGGVHVVRFSGMGAGETRSALFDQHAAADAALAESGLPYTLLRPNSFFQNLLWSAHTIKAQGVFHLPLADAKQSFVDVRDIADVAVKVLTTPGHAGATYEITGPEALSCHDLAATLSRVLERPVRYVAVPPEAALENMRQSGMPEWSATAVTDLYRAMATGAYARTSDAVLRLTGRPATTFEQFARAHAAAFR